MTKDMNDIRLPKWPALVVVGDNVTKDQAKEILIRTTSTYFHCNDREWNQTLARVFGYGTDEIGNAEWESLQRICKELDIINLEYLANDRISSSYVDGPHGWCDWNGNIGCNSHNIGKWPSVEDVTEEWTKIAKAFPFLNLKAQLFDGEHCEEGTKPLVEFQVANGKLSVTPPQGTIGSPNAGDVDYLQAFSNPHRERGCTEEVLQDAIDFVKSKVSD